MSRLRYQPALDGVRALAVIAVVGFHGGVAGLAGGYLGVDTFFVLSGFLITSLLITERSATGSIRLGAFWARRARRLLPALALMLLAVAVAGRWLISAYDFSRLRIDLVAALGYVANWRMIWRGSDYFAATAPPSLVQHTWSLGIEEQFYGLWPLVVAGLAAFWPGARWRKVLLAVCLVGAAASAIDTAVLAGPGTVDRVYFGTDTRAEALLVGAALAVGLDLWRRPISKRATGVAAALGVVITGWLWYAARTPEPLFHGGLLLAALATAVVLAHITIASGGRYARVLSFVPLVWLGRISYGVYLWHWPVFGLLNAERTHWSGLRLLAARLIVTLGIAALSYYLVELPVRGLVAYRPVAVGGLIVAYAAAAVVVLFLPTRVPPLAAAAPPIVLPSLSASPAQAARAPVHRRGRTPGAEPRVTFLGDSVAWTVGGYLPAHPGLWTSDRAIQGCGIATLPDILQLGTPHTNYPGCTRWPQRWQSAVNTDDPDVAVILLNRWELMDRRLGSGYQHVGEPGYDAYLRGQLDRAVAIAGSRGAAVVLLTAAYTHRAERPDGGLYPEDLPERVDAWNRLLLAEQESHPGVRLLDLNHVVCPHGTFTWTIDGIQVRSDGLHFTPEGVQRVIAPWLLPHVAAMARGTE